MNKYELQDKSNPHVRITVCSIKTVHELEAHGWERVQATVQTSPKADELKADGGEWKDISS